LVLSCGSADGSDDATNDALSSAPRKAHVFFVQTKGFIAPIASDRIGDLGNPVSDVLLRAFVVATNATFSENPQDGDGPAKTGQYRLWAQVALSLECVGKNVQDVTIADAQTDAGYEGPLKAVTDPLAVRSWPDGRFYFQARGRPAPAAEPAFEVIHPRASSTIWYVVAGHVTCDAAAQASVVFDEVTTTAFPSFRLWLTHKSGFDPEPPPQRVVDRAQGNFSELWSLPAPPKGPLY
jgi:hypothetical protein